VTIGRAFRAYLTQPELLPELVAIDGLPEDLRETLAERLAQRPAGRRPRARLR
jgi:hypothetical protein